MRDLRALKRRCGALSRLCAGAATIVLASAASSASAATNGLIAFESVDGPGVIATVDPLRPATFGIEAGVPIPGLPPGSANPAWSPDGTMLAFSTTSAGASRIDVINADGTGLRTVARDPIAAIDPTWSPDARQIAYTGLGGDGNPDIYVASVDGASSPRRLTAFPDIDQQADWSPDGKLIAYESYQGGGEHIWTMAPDGTAQTQRTSGPLEDSDAAWSPDGSRLAFSSGAPGSSVREIFSIDRSGGDRRQLTSSGERSAFPAWSPDGRTIAFARSRIAIVVIDRDGLPPGVPPMFVALGATDPTWAPLPPPVSQPTGTVTATTPSGKTEPVSPGQELPTGTKVDATEGALLVNFSRPAVPAAVPDSTARVIGAEFTIASRTPETLTLNVKRPSCSTGAVAAARRLRRPRKTKVRVRHGHFRVRNDHLIAASHETTWTVTETCTRSVVSVTEGSVDVRALKGKGRRVVRVRAGHSYTVKAVLR